MCEDRVSDWFEDLAGCEKAAVLAEVASWSPWLVNSLVESDIGMAELAAFLHVGRSCPDFPPSHD